MLSFKAGFPQIMAFLFVIFLFVSCNKDVKKKNTETSSPSKESVSKNIPVQTPSSYEKYLTAADVEGISGLKGVKSIPRNPQIGAGGDLNFSTADDKLIVMVQIVDQNNYEGYKKYFFKSAIDGLGDQAMKGATLQNRPENLVAFTKGNKCVALTVFVNKDDFSKNMLSIEQTSELAKTIASRM